jgi:hypothetical protein
MIVAYRHNAQQPSARLARDETGVKLWRMASVSGLVERGVAPDSWRHGRARGGWATR